jgi:hypothetical protein
MEHMESFLNLQAASMTNYLMGYLGAICVIAGTFNKWKNKLDKIGKVNSFKLLLPEAKLWSYQNFDDWLVMIILTPTLISFQPAIVFLTSTYYELDMGPSHLKVYHSIQYLISFIIGSISQTLGISLVELGYLLTSKMKSLAKKFINK